MERDLNEWVRFRRPGVYRVHVVSKRAWPASGAAFGIEEKSIFDPDRISLTSNILTLQIQSTPPDWAARQIADAVKVLDRPARQNPIEFESRRQAGRILRFLYTPEAAAELVKRRQEQQNGDPLIRTLHWEDREVDLGVRTSPFIDSAGRLIPAP